MRYDEEEFRETTVKELMKLGHNRKEALLIFDRSGILEGFRLNPSYYQDTNKKGLWAEDTLEWYNVRKDLGVWAV